MIARGMSWLAGGYWALSCHAIRTQNLNFYEDQGDLPSCLLLVVKLMVRHPDKCI